MTPLTVERPREQATQPTPRLFHLCRKHPFAGDGPCLTTCVALCGYRFRPDSETRIGPSDCVVCEAMFAAKYAGTT